MKSTPIIVFLLIIIIALAAVTLTPLGKIFLNQKPIAEAGPDQTVLVKKPIFFDGSGSKDLDGYIVKYLWDFGDGSTGEGTTISHIYTKPGTFTVTLKVTDNLGATATDTCKVTVTYVDLKTNVQVVAKEWQKNPNTDLPECKITIIYSVYNQGTAPDTALIRLYMNGMTIKQESSFLNPGGTYYGQYNTIVGYDTSHYFSVKADAWESSSSYSTQFQAILPRNLPEYARLFITPRDPVVIQKEAQITTNPFIPDLIELRDWVANNIKYRYDSEAHGMSDYWQLPRETISLGTGDCEDFSILLVSLLRANGYEPSDVYVMAGYKSGGPGHAWVVVETDLGFWWTIEPQFSTLTGLMVSILNGQLTEVSGYKAKYKFNDVEFYTIS